MLPAAEAVFAAAAAGDDVASAVIDSTGRATSPGPSMSWRMAYDVERIVLGGGVSHAGEPFMAPILAALDRFRAAQPLGRARCCRPIVVQLLPAGADAGAWGALA